MAGAGNLAGKAVIDATNPIADAAPVNGVLKFFTGLDESLMERLQKAFPDARLVKAFNSCLLYTSDAADERSSVDLGGRRIIKKKQRKKKINNRLSTKQIVRKYYKKTHKKSEREGG